MFEVGKSLNCLHRKCNVRAFQSSSEGLNVMNGTGFEAQPSPWHAGERAIQERLGVAKRMEAAGRRVIRDFMPDQHRTFYQQLPFVLMGTVDADGAVWATMLEGAPGFVSSPDPRRLCITARPDSNDPAAIGIDTGAAVGLLGIELSTRRRNRMNGRITKTDGTGFEIGVEHSFGNCPQYIQTREFSFARQPRSVPESIAERANTLDDEARSMIEKSDTFFVASYVDLDGDPARRAVDVSHRGGKAGFVRVADDGLSIPDFAGNLHFNTLGNLLVNPRAGLVFVDFVTGDVLQLSGRVEIVFDGPEVDAFQGAERIWRFRIEQVIRRRSALALRFQFGAFSPNSLMTGSWEEAEQRSRAQALRQTYRPFRVVQIATESQTIRSFYLEPTDDAGLPLFQAGQHLPLRFRLSQETNTVLRTYTISTAPSDGTFRISVKRQGVVSQHLHDHIAVGDIIEAKAPAGCFTVNARETRPLVLISGGVGITPMLAMLRHVVYEGLRTRRIRPTWFFHGSRTRAERPFDAEIANLAKSAREAVRVVQVLSGADEKSSPTGEYAGHIDLALLRRVLPFDDYDFYLCGPAAMVQSLYDGLREMRIPDDRIFSEAFGPSALRRKSDQVKTTDPPLPEPATASVLVRFAKSEKAAVWEPGGATLLEMAESQGIRPDSSCRGGSCGTCKTRVLKGEVTYTFPPAALRQTNEALICCALPAETQATDNVLVLDL